MNIRKFTLREVETAISAGGKMKKALIGDFYDYPFTPITASTFKTGKHGRAKTRMLIKDYFTNVSYSVIQDSDQLVQDMEHDLRYGTFEALVNSSTVSKTIVLTPDYELIEFLNDTPVQPDKSVLIQYFKGPEIKYKIKTILD